MKNIITKLFQLIITDPKKNQEADNTKQQHMDEFKSFLKRFDGKKLVWFLSLSETKKYDLFYEWKQYKYSRRETKKVRIQKRKIFNYFTGQYEVKTIKLYPASFKHFILGKMKTKKYFVSINKIRDTSLKILMNEL